MSEAILAEPHEPAAVTGVSYHVRHGGRVWMRDQLQCTRLRWKGCTIFVRLNERRPRMENGPSCMRLNPAQKFQEVLMVCCDSKSMLPEAKLLVRKMERDGRPPSPPE